MTAGITLAVAAVESDPSASPGIRIVSNRPFRAVSTPVVGADPARNLIRLTMHLQVFALSEHLAVRRLPLVHRQLAKGFRWLYFYLPLPFQHRAFPDRVHPRTVFPATAPGVTNTSAHGTCAWSTYAQSTSTLRFSETFGRSRSSSHSASSEFSTPSTGRHRHNVGQRSLKSISLQEGDARAQEATSKYTLSSSESLFGKHVQHLQQDDAPRIHQSENQKDDDTWHANPRRTLTGPDSSSSLSSAPTKSQLHGVTVSRLSSNGDRGSRVWSNALGVGRGLSSYDMVVVRRNLADLGSSNSTLILEEYGPEVLPPLTEAEYNYLAAWGNAFSTNYPFLESNWHGFKEFVSVMFWGGVFVFGLALLQTLLQLLWMACRGQWLYGLLDPPRLQFSCIALALPAVAWASTRLIIGSTHEGGKLIGLILGVVTMNVWAVSFVLAGAAISWVIVVQEQYARFFVREMTEPRKASCLSSLARGFWLLLLQKRLKGHWVTITPSERHILPRFGIFFEDYTVWGNTSFFGVLQDRLRILYSSVDFLKMMAVGVLFAVWGSNDDTAIQTISLLGVVGVQLVLLVVLQPFTERGIQVVEVWCVICQVVLFGGALLLRSNEHTWNQGAIRIVDFIMMLFMALGLVAQLINHWTALAIQVGRLLFPADDDKQSSHSAEEEEYTDDDVGDVG
eukprot:TRINITY_DN4612_c0_g2_i1.p1 TRINITY_DN4612_c0_g2~~TRINITY_DN4612_c0_g2_i1.p1  ORF type:complete len:688 (+),score=87.53 TRINITY_DN4612_c0_g2_i1:32-2065(+)